MPDRKPLVVGSQGLPQQLQAGDTVLGLARWVWEQHRLIEAPTDKTYMVCLSMFAGVVWESVTIQTTSGTLTARFYSGETAITGELAVTSTKGVYVSPTHFSAYMFLPENQELTLVVTDNASAEDLSFTLRGYFAAIPEAPSDFQGFAIAVSTQGVSAWSGPSPSESWWGQVIGSTTETWPDPSNPHTAVGTDAPPSTYGTSFGYGGSINGLAVAVGDPAGDDPIPSVPVVSYFNTSGSPSIAWHDGSDWNTVTASSISTLYDYGSQVKIFQAGNRVFLTGDSPYLFAAREVTYAGVGEEMAGPVNTGGIVGLDSDGVPMLVSILSGMRGYRLVDEEWTEDAYRADTIASIYHIKAGQVYGANSTPYAFKAVKSGGSWNYLELSEATNSPASGDHMAVIMVDGGDGPVPMGIWTNASQQDVYFEKADYNGGSPNYNPDVGISYTGDEYPTYVSVDPSGQLLAVCVRQNHSTAAPRVDIYRLNGRETPDFIGSKSFAGHYLPAEHQVYVDVSTSGNITLSGEQNVNGFDTSSSRVLVQNQTSAAQNGIYVSDSGAWTRATDADDWSELYRLCVLDFNSFNTYSCTVGASGTVGSTAITFTLNVSGKPLEEEVSDLGWVGIIWTPSVINSAVFPGNINNLIYPES